MFTYDETEGKIFFRFVVRLISTMYKRNKSNQQSLMHSSIITQFWWSMAKQMFFALLLSVILGVLLPLNLITRIFLV